WAVSSRWFTSPDRDQLGFGYAIQLVGCRCRGSLCAFQCDFKAFRDQSLANRLHCLPPAIIRLSNLYIRPLRSIGIRLEQHLRSLDLFRRSLEPLNDFLAHATFFSRKSDGILLVHGTPPGTGQCPLNLCVFQPQFLAWWGH